MYKIITKEQFSDKVFCMEVEAPLIARSCKPGNFVIVRVDKVSERVPYTIAKADAEKAEKAKIAAAKAENCRMATQAKAQMDTGKAVRRPNDKGEMVFLNDAQRSAEAARIDKIIGSDCKH